MNLLWALGTAALMLAVLVTGAWAALALYFRGPRHPSLRYTLVAIALAVTVVAAVDSISHGALVHGVAFALHIALFTATLLWWWWLAPRHDRDWAADVERLLYVERCGDRVTLDNVRAFDWRTRDDFEPRWERREYDLSTLCAVDLFVSYWMGPAIAHTLVSFAFADGRHLVFSVEVRRTRGQAFSALGDLFKQTELVLVAADEHDIIRTRSNIRRERVYVYRVDLPASERRALFEAYLREAERLVDEPRFYNTLFSNCTTIVYDMVKRIVPGLAWDRRLLLSGHLPAYIYELGALDTSRPFDELVRRGHIDARAIAHDGATAGDIGDRRSFSRAIRRGVPAPDGSFIEAEDHTDAP